jgi:hypothetical protein
MNVEERVRIATRARADLVRDIQPLELPAEQPHRQPPRPGARRWLGFSAPVWAAPVAAAAVIVALAVVLVTTREVRHQPTVSPATSTSAAAAVATIAGGVPAATVPRYYAALDDPSGTAFSDPYPGHVVLGPVSVLVGGTRTGQRVATVRPPHGQTFVGVTAAAGDQTFVLAAASLQLSDGIPSPSPAAWYLLRIAPGGAHPATLTRLPIPGEPTGTQVSGISLSPNGGYLAVLFQRGVWQSSSTSEGPLTLVVYSVSTGRALRTWTQQTKFPAGFGWYWGRYSNTSITWLANGHTLAFADGFNSGSDGPPLGDAFGGVKIRTINLNRPSGDLLADSEVVFTSKNHWCMTLQLTADGKTVICGSYYGNTEVRSAQSDPEITDYSVATGKARLVYRLGGAYELGLANILWASPDGSTLIASVLTQSLYSGPGDVIQGNAGLLAKGVLTPLPFPLGTPYVGQIAL